MPTVEEHLAFAYPFLFDAADSRFVPQEVLDWAMGVSSAFRPPCLDVERQNLAQAYYAAHLIRQRLGASISFVAASYANAPPAGPVVERQEGDVRVRYADVAASAGKVAATTAAAGDPWGAYVALASLCGPVAGNPLVPPRYRGGVITRFGIPK